MMTSTRQKYWEIIWWMAILALAALVVLAMTATPLYGQATIETAKPAAAMYELTMGVDAYRAQEFEHARWHLARADGQLPAGAEVPSLLVWQVLAAQADGDHTAALHGWEAVVMDSPNEVWKQLGMAAAMLDAGRLEDTETALDVAFELSPDNPVLHYLSGLVYLEQADQAMDYLDATGPEWFKLAVYGRPQVLPNSKAMYRLAAMHDLERAIEEADNVCSELSLVPGDLTLAAGLQPTVGDLLVAVGADHFEADAHNMLGSLYLEAGQEELAEEHMDAATKLDVHVLYGYADLAESYLNQNRPADAARAFSKAYREDPERGAYAVKALQNAARALRESLLR